MSLRLRPANDHAAPDPHAARSPWLLEWLAKLAQPGFSLSLLNEPIDPADKISASNERPQADDWIALAHICGYGAPDFMDAQAAPPLSAAEIDYFRRNHRGTESHISREFLTAQSDLPSPLAELYGLYLHRVRMDVEAALWVAQSTASTRVARAMADLLAIGAFANGGEYVSYLGLCYSVPAAFDTSAQIDRANLEALRRLAMPPDHPSHLLKLTPDELGVLATSIAERTALPSAEFLEKANLLSEARQDVTRLSPREHFATAVTARDLPLTHAWGARLAEAFARVLPRWVSGLPEVQAVLH